LCKILEINGFSSNPWGMKSRVVRQSATCPTRIRMLTSRKLKVEQVMDGIMDPYEAQEAHKRFLKMLKPKEEKKVEKIELSKEEWSIAFKAFRKGTHLVDL
jgi:hypothetical protein